MNITTDYRPTNFNELVGQDHLLNQNGVLYNMLKAQQLKSMIFYGAPGTGKTTTAMILAKSFNLEFHSINATNLSLDNIVSDKKTSLSDILKSLVANANNKFLLYLDEIQYLNKKQQQLFLPYIENNNFILIASTTENPYYEIYNALLSRCQILEFKPVSDADIIKYLKHITDDLNINIDDNALKFIAGTSAGDVRRAANLLETAIITYQNNITATNIDNILPSIRMAHYDKNGNDHYALMSALQKSIRGSDPDASVFYLCRLLEGGDLETVIRRLMVIAHEDIGLANPDAINITYSSCQMARQLGMPEANKPLTNCVLYLALSNKCSTCENSYFSALKDVQAGLGANIPEYLNKAHAKGYKFPHDYPYHWCPQQYLPDDIKDNKYYMYDDHNKFERDCQERLWWLERNYYANQKEYEAIAFNKSKF